MVSNELWVLSGDHQSILDTLSLDFVRVEETREIGKPRLIKVTHPIREFPDDELSRYLSIIRQGNKVWWPETPDGDGCLYVINSEITIDPLMNQITFYAEDVGVELSYLPPVEYPTHFFDRFVHSLGTRWVTHPSYTSGSASVSNGRLTITGNTGGTYCKYIPLEKGAPFMATVVMKPLSFPNISMDGGIRVFRDGATAAYTWSRGKDSGGNHKKWVNYWTGSSWVQLWVGDDNLYNSLILRVVYDGSQTTFQQSQDSGKSFADLVTDNTAGRGWSLSGVGLHGYNRFASYFLDFKLYTPDGFRKTFDATALTNLTGGLFTAVERDGSSPVLPVTAYLGGYLSPMMVLREIEAEAGVEFSFRYEYDPTTGVINRYLEVGALIGESVDVVLDPLYDFSEFQVVEDEGEYYSQCAPIMKEASDPSKLPAMVDAFSKYKTLSISQGSSVRRRVDTGEAGHPVNLGSTTAPYSKSGGSMLVTGTDTVADYRTIYKPDGSVVSGKTGYVESGSDNEYNVYWDVVDKLREVNTPAVKVEGRVKMSSLKDLGVNLKVGDRVQVKLPWTTDTVELRVEKTVKNSFDSSGFTVELGNRQVTAVNKWLGRFKPTTVSSKIR